MKLRTKLLCGTQLLLLLALLFFGVTTIYTSRDALLREARERTQESVQLLLEQMRELNNTSAYDDSALLRRARMNYKVKQLSAESSHVTEFIVQTETENIFNRQGFYLWDMLKTGTPVETESEEKMFSRIFRYEGRDYCAVGNFNEWAKTEYLSAAVRDITDSMEQVRRLTWRCLMVGVLTLLLAAALEGLFLYGILRPLDELQRGAGGLARGEYGNRIELRRKDELKNLADSFNRMAEAVEAHIHSLEEVAEDRRQLLAALAHEMKTPVTAITGYAYALRYGRISPDQREEAVVFVDEQSRRLERLSDKLSRLILLEQSVGLVPISPEALLEEASHTLSPLALQQGINLRFAADKIPVRGDEDLLISLITNLYDNARKAGAKQVSVTLRQRVLCVTDDGCGMEVSELAKIMQPFYKIDRSRNREGFGLGLALCQRIVELHGAVWDVTSNPGEGSSFRVAFPLMEEERQQTSTEKN